MKQSLAIFFVVFFIADFAAGQQKFEPTVDYRREAIAKGQVREFLNAMEAMAPDAETRQNWDRASRAYSEASVAARTIGQLQKSVSHATKAIEMGQRAKDPQLQASAILFLTSAYQSLGQSEKEREWLQKGVEIAKEIKTGAKEVVEARLYTQLGQNFRRQGEPHRAIEYISYALQALEARLTFYKGRRIGPGSSVTSFAPVIQGTQAGLADECRASNSETAPGKLLDPGVTVLEYFVPRGRAMLWVVEKDRVSFVRLSLNRSELISKVTALRESIYQAGEKDKFKQASEELYKALIEPALPHIRGKELLIIPHDVLHYIPYQALLSSQGKYLIQDYPIYYLSSASLMQFTREKRKSTRERALVMGNPSLGDPAYNLRFAEREAREVARVYPKSDVYLRAEATKPKAISLSPNYDILHFAVHGELRQDDPLNSGLLLAEDGKEDGRLRVGEIFSLNLKADTVVLSACESGLGKITSGDEIIGLTRSFIYAGTPSIITTLWKVNDRTSYELVREFYSNLTTMRKSEALRQAQLKTMEEFPHPFFWAAYGLTGEP